MGAPRYATRAIAKAINDLLGRNDYTEGAEVGEVYLGRDVLVAQLKRTKVIEGQWEDVDRTADLFDLMDAHRAETGRK